MDPWRLFACRLSKEGYGTVEQIEEMRADRVIDLLEYSNFLGDYEATSHELNKDRHA